MKKYIWLVALSLICGQSFFLFPLVTRATQQPVSTIHPNPILQKLETYIGDKHIAKAISRVRGTIKINGKEVPKAYLVAAIGKIESDYRPQIVGDGGDSYGLFQIQRKHHGRFTDGLESQVDKCESILRPLKQTITGYHTGADIHDSVEAAKRHASNNTIAQCKIEFTVN